MARFCDSGRQPSDSDRLNMYTKNAIMSKGMSFSLIALCISGVELHLASNDTGTSTIPKIANVVNGSETNIPQVDMLTTEVPVFAQDHSVNADTSEPQLNSQTIYDQPSSSSEHWNYDAISNVTVQCGLLPNTSRAATFLDIVRGFNDSISKMLPGDGYVYNCLRNWLEMQNFNKCRLII